MNITIHNYEPYLMDYLDGNLNANEVAEVLLFLEKHPEIKEEFAGFITLDLQHEESSLDISSLYKPSFEEALPVYEPLLVAELEKDISTEEYKHLQQGLKLYPELKHQQKLFAQTKLVPDVSIVFAHKNQLKKETLFVLYAKQITRIAAILLLIGLAGISYLLQQSSVPSTQMAQQINQVTQPPIVAPQPNIVQHTPTPKPKSNPITTPHQEGMVKPKTNTVVLIAANEKSSIQTPTDFLLEPLHPSNQQLSYQQPPKTNDNYIPLMALVRKAFQNESKNIENKTIATLHEVNQTAGVVIKKDSTGKINHFEIGALGFAWSK